MRYNLMHNWLEVQDASVPGGLHVLPVGSFRGFVLAAAGNEPERRFGTYRGPGPNGRLALEELCNAGPVHLLMRHEVEFASRRAERGPARRNAAGPRAAARQSVRRQSGFR